MKDEKEKPNRCEMRATDEKGHANLCCCYVIDETGAYMNPCYPAVDLCCSDSRQPADLVRK